MNHVYHSLNIQYSTSLYERIYIYNLCQYFKDLIKKKYYYRDIKIRLFLMTKAKKNLKI